MKMNIIKRVLKVPLLFSRIAICIGGICCASIAYSQNDVSGACQGTFAFIHGSDGARDARAWLSNGDGTFKSTYITTATGLSRYGQGTEVFGLEGSAATFWADIDQDGDVDIIHATENNNNSIYVFLNNGDNTFQTTPITTTGIQPDGSGEVFAGVSGSEQSWLRDTNGDGMLDYVFSNNRDQITVWFGDGAGHFSTTISKQTTLLGAGGHHTSGISGSESFLLDDVTGDGIVDLIGTYDDSSTGRIIIWKGVGDGTFITSVYYTRLLEDTGGSNSSGSADNEYSQFSDIDGDGYMDYIHAESYDSTLDIWVWLNDKTGKFPTAPIRTTVPNVVGNRPPGGGDRFANYTGNEQSFFVDINGDNLPDFVTTNDNSGTNSGISVYMNLGNSLFSTTPINTLLTNFRTGSWSSTQSAFLGCGFVVVSPICSPSTPKPLLSASSINNVCPSTTVNLQTVTASNKPSAATLTWHTSIPASNSNKVTNVSAYGTNGTLYASFFDATNNCYAANGTAITPFNVAINSCVSPAAGTIACNQTQLSPIPVVGVASQVVLRVTVNVTTIGTFPVSVSGSGMSLANGLSEVTATTTGIQSFFIPLKYDGSALGTLVFTIGAAGQCSVDLSSNAAKKKVISDVWTLDNCTYKVAAPTLK